MSTTDHASQRLTSCHSSDVRQRLSRRDRRVARHQRGSVRLLRWSVRLRDDRDRSFVGERDSIAAREHQTKSIAVRSDDLWRHFRITAHADPAHTRFRRFADSIASASDAVEIVRWHVTRRRPAPRWPTAKHA